MATHFSILAWRVPGTGEPVGLPSMGSHRVRHDWSDLAAAAAFWNQKVFFFSFPFAFFYVTHRISSYCSLELSLEKEMATRSSILAWRVPGTAEPGGLPSMGSHRVGHYWSDLAARAPIRTKIKINASWSKHIVNNELKQCHKSS